MKIKIVSDLREASTGISRYTEMIYNSLKNEVEVEVIPLEPKGISKVAIFFAKLLGFDLRTTLKNYPLYLNFNKDNSTIWHFTNQQQALLLNYIKPKKSVVTVHDIIPVASPFPLSSKPGQWMFRMAMNGLRKADRLIADSEATKQDIIRCCNYPADRIDVVYLGVDSNFFKPRNEKKQEQEFKILYTGSDMPRKNIKTLILAFSKLLGRGIKSKLILVASAQWPRAREGIVSFVNQLGLKDSVVFKHNLSNEQLRDEYQNADLFIFPSLYEGFGLPVLEAMACGCPVICSNATSLPEVGGNALLYFNPDETGDLAEKMCQVLADKNLQEELRQKGLERAKQFTWEKTAKQTMEIYQKIK